MAGLIVLAGGSEFQKGMESADKYLIEQAGGDQAPVAILPTAGGADGGEEMAARNGVNWFKQLGSRNVEAVMVVDRPSASDLSLVAKLEKARLIYLAGGSPLFLLQSLQRTPAWEAILRAWHNGAILGGSSAGAMVLARGLYDPGSGGVVPGFGLVEIEAVMPHHNNFGRRWYPKLAALLPGSTLVGIDEKTAMIGNGNNWRVYGKSWVTVYRENGPGKFVSGQPFKLKLEG